MNAEDNNDTGSPIECCVCMVDESTDVFALWNDDHTQLLGLSDIPENSQLLGLINGGKPSGAPQVILKSACTDHAICSYCLHHLATSFGNNHPVGPKNPMIPCPYPFKACLTPSTGLANYFSHGSVEKLLTPPEIELYRAHTQRYQFPGFELVTCPRPSRYGTTCGAGILVSLDDIRIAPIGRLIMRCDQSVQCQRQTCYHCKSLVHRSRDYCEYCVTSLENINPKLLNCYFHRLDKTAGDGRPNLYRNEELTEEIVIAQIKEIVAADRLEVRCTECLTFMFKTELCNTLEHCGIERCYSCGRSGTTTKNLGDHWDSYGHKGCPRFDHSIFWNVMANCKFRCVESDCYGGEVGDCDVEEHHQGIQNMIDTRKRAHIYHGIKSLLPELRQSVLNKLWLIDSVRPFMPACWADDYRTYIADCIRQTADQANKLLESAAASATTLDRQTVELAQSIVSKASTLKFTDITYPELPPPPPPLAKRITHSHERTKMLFEKFKMRYIKPRKLPEKKNKTMTQQFQQQHQRIVPI